MNADLGLGVRMPMESTNAIKVVIVRPEGGDRKGIVLDLRGRTAAALGLAVLVLLVVVLAVLILVFFFIGGRLVVFRESLDVVLEYEA